MTQKTTYSGWDHERPWRSLLCTGRGGKDDFKVVLFLPCHQNPHSGYSLNGAKHHTFLAFLQRYIVNDVSNVELHKLFGIDASRPLFDVIPKRVEPLAVIEGMNSRFFHTSAKPALKAQLRRGWGLDKWIGVGGFSRLRFIWRSRGSCSCCCRGSLVRSVVLWAEVFCFSCGSCFCRGFFPLRFSRRLSWAVPRRVFYISAFLLIFAGEVGAGIS